MTTRPEVRPSAVTIGSPPSGAERGDDLPTSAATSSRSIGQNGRLILIA